jgi:hypothetical protein
MSKAAPIFARNPVFVALFLRCLSTGHPKRALITGPEFKEKEISAAGKRTGGNPYKVGSDHYTAREAVTLYRRDLITGSLPFTIDDVRWELKGRDLICWRRPGAPCHADVLLAVAKDEGWAQAAQRRHIQAPVDPNPEGGRLTAHG